MRSSCCLKQGQAAWCDERAALDLFSITRRRQNIEPFCRLCIGDVALVVFRQLLRAIAHLGGNGSEITFQLPDPVTRIAAPEPIVNASYARTFSQGDQLLTMCLFVTPDRTT